MLLDRQHFGPHRVWALFTLAATLGATVWYVQEALASDRLPGGSSVSGFTFGVLGGLICVFELLLWPRKKVRSWRIGRGQAWLRAHIWLGLLSVPLLVYHSGFRFGGPLSTVVMVLFLVVIASGVWGLALQQFLPRKLLHEVPAETIYSQIDYVAKQYCIEAERLVLAVCGPAPGEEATPGGGDEGDFLTIGAVRSAGQFQGKVLQTRVPRAPVPGCEALRTFYFERIEPYLREGGRHGSPLRYEDRSSAMFGALRALLPQGAQQAVDTLEETCEQRRQLDRQGRIHFWLHNWLWVHLPLAVALIALMFVHVWVAMKYW